MYATFALVALCIGVAHGSIFFEKSLSADCKLTKADVLGPYYKKGAPLKQVKSDYPPVCANSPANDRLFLNGTIRLVAPSQPCGKPTRALLDIWHADCNGVYSNTSPNSPDYSCRTVLLTDTDGFFSLSTTFPGRYDDNGYRPAHIHFRITPMNEKIAPIGDTLTTQLYFARDMFLGPSDSCQVCHSGDSTLIIPVENDVDVKTFSGSWNVLVAGHGLGLKF